MNRIDLNHFRAVLRDGQTESAGYIHGREALALESSPDELDRIQNATERDYAIGALERRSSQWREITGALGRLDQGSFGTCASCHQAIHPKRLAAVPWALYCIACQQAEDHLREEPASGGEGHSLLSEAA